jgi:hypothetical protein
VSDRELLEHCGHPADVIGVWMRRNHQVDFLYVQSFRLRRYLFAIGSCVY